MARIDFTFSIAEEDAPRVVLASAKAMGWEEGGIETIEEASLRYWKEQVKAVVVNMEKQEAIEAARNIQVIEPDVI